MTIDQASLQQQVLELTALAPQLAPLSLPRSANLDILQLAESEDNRGCQALLEVLAVAGSEVRECTVCGSTGEFIVGSGDNRGESILLRATLQFKPDYNDRLLIPVKCQFACGICRQMQTDSSLLQELSKTNAGEDSIADILLEHLALANDELEIAEDRVACQAWGQEIVCRAYALHIASSALAGWKLVDAERQPFKRGATGAAAELALKLLLPEASAEERTAALQSALEAPGDEAGDLAESTSASDIEEAHPLKLGSVSKAEKSCGSMQPEGHTPPQSGVQKSRAGDRKQKKGKKTRKEEGSKKSKRRKSDRGTGQAA